MPKMSPLARSAEEAAARDARRDASSNVDYTLRDRYARAVSTWRQRRTERRRAQQLRWLVLSLVAFTGGIVGALLTGGWK